MEGATGITSWFDVIRDMPQYEKGRELLTHDINAAIKGALNGGATEIWVNDEHLGSRHVLINKLDSNASVIIGSGGRKFSLMEDIDASFNGVFLVAYHAREGTTEGVLNHTWMPNQIRNVWVNGKVIGETAISSLIAGHFNVPVALVTGDDYVTKEAKDLLGDVETAVVKYGISRYCARCLPPEESSKIIQKSAEKAMQRLKDFKPLKMKTPLKFEVELMTTIQATGASLVPGVTLIDSRKVKYDVNNAIEAIKQFRCITSLANDPVMTMPTH